MTAARRSPLALVLVAVLCAVLIPLVASAQTSTTSSLIVKLIPGLTADQQAAVIERNGGTETSSIPALRLHVIAVPTADLETVRASYAADAQVVSVEDNKTRQSETIPADALYSNQWALPKIGWESVFGTVAPTGTAKVFVLDTGIDALHPDLAGEVLPGKSMLDSSDATTDPSGHGTWLAGIIAANTNTSEGIAGVAYDGVKVVPVRVLDANGLGQDSDVIAGVLWAADNGANVILMAFSNPGFSQNLQDAIDYAWSKGIVLVAAVGNNAVSMATFPAGDRGVMGVAATDQNDAQAYFSNEGQSVFIAAPGIDIPTTDIGSAYSTVTGTSSSSAIVAGVAAFMKAVDPSLSNGVIVGRIARNADPAGTQVQTGNGRVNMERALTDTSTEEVQPAGAAPVGAGGPFVGPYVAAAVKLVLNGGLNIISPAGAVDKTVNTNQSFVVQVTISNQNNTPTDTPRTWSNISAVLTVPAGFTKTPDLSGASLGNATAGGTSTCGAGVTTTNCTFTWTVTAPNTASNPFSITVAISGTPSSGASCSGGNQCSDTSAINGIAVVNPAALSITSFTAQQGPSDVIVKSGDSITLALTAANGAIPRATAIGVAGSSVTVTPTGTASASCGAASAPGNIAADGNRVFTYTCNTITGNGTLVFGASVSGTDENTGDTVSAGPASTNTITVDSTSPTSGLTPIAGTYLAPFSFSWNITDPTVNGVSSGVVPATCNVTVGGSTVSTLCSGSQSLGAGTHAVMVTATDVAGNALSDSRNYVVVSDNTPPVVTLTFPAATGLAGFYITPSVVGSVAANDTTTGNSNISSLTCSGASVGAITGLGTPSASAPVTVTGEGPHSVICTAGDSAGNSGAASGSSNTATVNIDSLAPNTSITANPSNPTNSTSASFSFNGTDPAPSSGGPTFECSLDGPNFAACTSPQTYSSLTDGSHTFSVRAKDTAGNIDATPATFTWTIDTKPPKITVSFPAPNLAGWYTTSPVVGSVSATDASNVTAINCTGVGVTQGGLVGGGTATASRSLSVTGEGTHTISCEATDGTGNTGVGDGSTETAVLKIDTVPPVVSLNAVADTCSLPGSAGWCRGTQTAGFTATDATSGVATPCTGASCNFTQSTATNGSAVMIASGQACDVAGNCTAGINAGPYKIDSVAPGITISAPVNAAAYVLNQAVASSYGCTDATSLPNTCAGPVANGADFDTLSVGAKQFKVDASDVAGNTATLTHLYSVLYASGGLCQGAPGHAILQPINADGSSVFKQKSTVPAKFRVCDALGNSIGTPGVVTNFRLIQKFSGVVNEVLDVIVDSTTPDSAFRWDPTDQQWIFNVNTKSLQAGFTYVYQISLNDGSNITFQFGLK